MAKGFFVNRVYVALPFLALLFNFYIANAAQCKKAPKPSHASFPTEPAITYLPVTSQGAYESNPQQNLYKGKLLFGLFATFNAVCMLDDAHNRPRGKKIAWTQDVTRFNAWLKQRKAVVKQLIQEAKQRPKPEERGFGNLHEGELSRLLSLPYDNFYRENITFLELEHLRTYFITQSRTHHFVPPTDDIIEAITLYRTTRTPQAVVLNTGGHWIAILLAGDGTCKVADSLNAGAANKHHIKTVYQLFTQQPLLDAARLAQLRQQYGHHEDASTASSEEAGKKEEPTAAADNSNSNSDSDDENNFFAPRRKQAKPSSTPPSQQVKVPYDQKAYEKAQENKGKQNLKGANLRGADLSGLNLEEADFTDADLTGANLSKAQLNGARFIRTILNGTSFKGARLANAQFIEINKEQGVGHGRNSVIFDQAFMGSVTIQDCDFSGNNAQPGVTFVETSLFDSTVVNSNLTGAVFQAACLNQATFEHVNLTSAMLYNLSAIYGLTMDKVTLQGATINYFSAQSSIFTEVNFDHTKIVDFILIESIVRKSHFCNAKISKWYNESTVLSCLDFTNALLDQCCFCSPISVSRNEQTLLFFGWRLNFSHAIITNSFFLGGAEFVPNRMLRALIPSSQEVYWQTKKELHKLLNEEEVAALWENLKREMREDNEGVRAALRGTSMRHVKHAFFVASMVTPAVLVTGPKAFRSCPCDPLQAFFMASNFGRATLRSVCFKDVLFTFDCSFDSLFIANRTDFQNCSFSPILFASENFAKSDKQNRDDVYKAFLRKRLAKIDDEQYREILFKGLEKNGLKKINLPSIAYYLRSKGARVNGTVDDAHFGAIWGKNPDLLDGLGDILSSTVNTVASYATNRVIGLVMP